MADLSEIQVGGRLRVELPIVNRDPHGLSAGSPSVEVDIDGDRMWIDGRFAESLEYIPPPKPAFKRGDWVKTRIADEGWQTGGLVLSVYEPAIGPQRAEVSWPSWTIDVRLVTDLEPDEAPND